MSIWDSALIAIRALRVNPLRSLLTILGIVVGVAAVMAMVAIGSGARAQVADQIRSLGTNLLMVIPGPSRTQGTRGQSGSAHTLTESDARAIFREVPLVEAAVPVIWGIAQAVHTNRNWSGGVFATIPDYFPARDWPIARGRSFTSRETATSAKVAVIGQTVADQLFGEDDPLGKIIRLASVPVTVVGVLSRKGLQADGRDQDDRVYLPISTAKSRVLRDDRRADRNSVAYVWTKLSSADMMESARQQIRSLLRHRHRIPANLDDDFWIRDPAAALGARHAATKTMTVLLSSIASVSLVVGGISIMNIMLVSITERTREIGLRLAVGAQPRDILGQFLIESVTLCTIGGLLGLAVGASLAIAVASYANWPVLIGLETVLLAVVFSAAVGVFFGFYPALKASRLDPIDALRLE